MRRPNARPRPSDPSTASTMSDDSSKSTGSPRVAPPGLKRSRTAAAAAWISLAAVAGIYYLFVAYSRSDAMEFGIIIDGGSTGTRIHVFGFRNGNPVMDAGSTEAMKVAPGLSSYAGDPEGSGESLMELLEFAKERVPTERCGDTEIKLMATAGLRLLDVRVSEMILESCRKVLRSSGFRFQDDWATVISGSDEGIYAWVAANYALGTLGGDPQKTTGIFELGGASAQVTFVSIEPMPSDFSHVLKFGEATYNLYSHSFLHLGQNVAYDSLRELLSSGDLKTSSEFIQEKKYIDPCTPKGYLHRRESLKISADSLNLELEYQPFTHAFGNFSKCRSAALMLLQKGKDKCSYPQCHLGSAFIPKLQGRLLATENFFYTSQFFGLGSATLISDIMLAGERFCEQDWLVLKEKYHALDEEDLVRYCFSSAYIVALLHDSLGIAVDDTRVQFANQVGDTPLDWALGAFIMQRASNHSIRWSDWITAVVGNEFSWLTSLLIISTFSILAVWSILRCKKVQLKTIYDLEKGRYVTKCLNR